MSDPNKSILEGVNRLLYLFGLICNAVLNIFGPLNILFRLIRHRHYMIAVSGRSSAMARGYGSISNILLESGVLNIPVTLVATILLIVMGGRYLIIGIVLAVNGQVWV